MRKFCLLFCLLLGSGAFAQTDKKRQNLGVIIGNVLSAENSLPVAYASVWVKTSGDSLTVRSAVTDKNGAFEVDNLPFGLYRLQISSVGFATLWLDSLHIREERYDFNLGDIKLKAAGNNLDEVIVYAEKPLIENRDGKITYNIGESALSQGSSTAEILKNMPLVNNDPNGKILLKGKEPKILIDDKPVDLSPQQLTDLLESLPGGSIEKIELMLNPPPQFATEQGGVINIVTKKGKVGLVGRVNLSAGTRGEGNLNTNLSYRTRRWNFSVNAGAAASQVQGNSYSRRENLYKDSTNYFHTDGEFKNKNLRPNLRFQTDYEIDKHHQFNFVYQGNLNYFDNESHTRYTNINRQQQVYRASRRRNASAGSGYSESFNLTYTYKAKNPAEVLRFIAVFNHGKNGNDRDFFQQFLNNDFTASGNDSIQQQLANNLSNGYNFRLNYDKPLKRKGAHVSTGASFQRSNYHNELLTQFLRQSDKTWMESELLSTDFRFHQSITTLRASLTWPLGTTLRLIAGAQAENTRFDFEFLRGTTAPVANRYWNLLPHVTLRKEFNRQFNTALVYRSAIRRPGIGELNPSVDYNDPYNIRFGNPYLQASLSDNFDWNLTLTKGKYYVNTSLGYNRVKDVFNTIRTLIDGGRTEVTWQNISDRQEYEASVWGGYTFSKKLRMNASAGYTYNVYDQKEKDLYRYRDGGSFYTSLNYNFTASPLLNFEGNARFSSFADPQGRSRSNLTMNLGVQQKLMEKRLILAFNIIDPFRRQSFTTYTYGKSFFLESFSSTRTRNFRLSVSYQLNRMVQKKPAPRTQKAIQEAVKKVAPKPKAN